MKTVITASLVCLIGICVMFMVLITGLDSRERAIATKAYLANRTAETEAALERAKTHDHRYLLQTEAFMLCIIGALSFALYKVRKSSVEER